jgi:hypothetical protein
MVANANTYGPLALPTCARDRVPGEPKLCEAMLMKALSKQGRMMEVQSMGPALYIYNNLF